jgi:hypothetical protein
MEIDYMPCPDCGTTNIMHYSWCHIHEEDPKNPKDWKEINRKRQQFKKAFLSGRKQL